MTEEFKRYLDKFWDWASLEQATRLGAGFCEVRWDCSGFGDGSISTAETMFSAN